MSIDSQGFEIERDGSRDWGYHWKRWRRIERERERLGAREEQRICFSALSHKHSEIKRKSSREATYMEISGAVCESVRMTVDQLNT